MKPSEKVLEAIPDYVEMLMVETLDSAAKLTGIPWNDEIRRSFESSKEYLEKKTIIEMHATLNAMMGVIDEEYDRRAKFEAEVMRRLEGLERDADEPEAIKGA